MSNYYDPWQHAIHIFLKRIIQYIALTITLGFLAWYGWVHFHFGVGIWDATKLAISSEASALKALLIMCFVCAGVITGWLFTWLIGSRKQKSDNHYRGSRINND
jgi:hypothetical protein